MSQRQQTRIGYNNPAYCNQFDDCMYDYEYVPEIDPDSPEFQRKNSYRVTRQIPPYNIDRSIGALLNKSSSDESTGSIIVEERNNRKVTLICEKRKPDVAYDGNGGYFHDISMESSDGDCDELATIDRRSGAYTSKNRENG